MLHSLYVHLPFCRRRCSYCDFYSQTNLSLKASYIRALEKDALNFKDLCGKLKTLYIGGGTPSVFTAEEFNLLFDVLRNNFSFEKNCEITVELNPRSATKELLTTLGKNLVNRLSIGIQFFEAKLLKKARREHSPEDAERLFYEAREAGFHNISTDIIYAFPGQDVKSFERTLKKIIGLSPEHISSYMYSPPSGRSGILTEAPPEDEVIEAMYNLLCGELSRHGYSHYEISSFARKGRESIHNLNYWKGRPWAGLGAGAVSSYGNKRLTGASLKKYLRAPLAKSEEILNGKQINFERKFLALRTLEGIPYRKKHDKYISLGWLEKTGGKTVFTEKGWLLSNSIIGEL
ncbi:MAG: coproporphyrinogen III oxidase [Elusimicrobia bacterium CG_4_8_14_3_um_filter_50_9]|nr:MAG: coproporphyrinogen III oxidase [Elusimicrobia bacterium CG_4_8_14_3_um_filter_50_9]